MTPPATQPDCAPLLERFKASGRELTIHYDPLVRVWRLRLVGATTRDEAVVPEKNATAHALVEALESLLSQ